MEINTLYGAYYLGLLVFAINGLIMMGQRRSQAAMVHESQKTTKLLKRIRLRNGRL